MKPIMTYVKLTHEQTQVRDRLNKQAHLVSIVAYIMEDMVLPVHLAQMCRGGRHSEYFGHQFVSLFYLNSTVPETIKGNMQYAVK